MMDYTDNLLARERRCMNGPVSRYQLLTRRLQVFNRVQRAGIFRSKGVGCKAHLIANARDQARHVTVVDLPDGSLCEWHDQLFKRDLDCRIPPAVEGKLEIAGSQRAGMPNVISKDQGKTSQRVGSVFLLTMRTPNFASRDVNRHKDCCDRSQSLDPRGPVRSGHTGCPPRVDTEKAVLRLHRAFSPLVAAMVFEGTA